MEFFEVSAKTADNVDLAFTTLARKLVLKKYISFLFAALLILICLKRWDEIEKERKSEQRETA